MRGKDMNGHYGLHFAYVVMFLAFVAGFVWMHRK